MIALKTEAELRHRRHQVEIQKERLSCGGCTHPVTPDILSSWQRSAALIPQPPDTAPRDSGYMARLAWEASPLRSAATPELGQITQLVGEGTLVAAIADPQGTLLWTAASQPMCGLAEKANLIPGGHWAEPAAGTNAIGLALMLQQPCTVFAAEHYLPTCQDWVCYAAPIIHPQAGQLAGVLAFALDWKRHTPFGEGVVAHLAQAIAQRLPACQPQAELEIHALGQPWVLFQGKPLHLSLRQLEILCILALNPDGLTLETLHAALCGDTSTCPATVKTLLTQLRHLLDGQISSHPYRLQVPVWADFLALPAILRQGHLAQALKLYHGELLPPSAAPEIEEWRNHLEAGMGKLLRTCTDAKVLIDHADNLLCTPLIRERLLELAV